MEKTDVLEEIRERTDGDIYLGVVGPVRTGKSTFIRRFMELLVLPNIEDVHEREVARDELPQSGTGRTVMTTEPKFIPANAAEINIQDGFDIRVRMVDCVGYVVPDALGFDENKEPRMVKSPWHEQEIPFEEAAEIGTRKVITDHSTIGLLITTDGSITDIERKSYLEAEQRVVEEMKELDKPFVMVLNSTCPNSTETLELAKELSGKYDVACVPVNAMEMDNDDIMEILKKALYEFPITEIEIYLPDWLKETEENHWLRKKIESGVNEVINNLHRVRDIDDAVSRFSEMEETESAELLQMDLSTGKSKFYVGVSDDLFNEVLSEYAGEEIEGKETILRLMRTFACSDKEWNKIKK